MRTAPRSFQSPYGAWWLPLHLVEPIYLSRLPSGDMEMQKSFSFQRFTPYRFDHFLRFDSEAVMNLKLERSYPGGKPPRSDKSGKKKKLKGANQFGRPVFITFGEVIAIRIMAGSPSQAGCLGASLNSFRNNQSQAPNTHSGASSGSSFSSSCSALFSLGASRYPRP